MRALDRLADEIWCIIFELATEWGQSADIVWLPFHRFNSRGNLKTKTTLPLVCRRWQALSRQFLVGFLEINCQAAIQLGDILMNPNYELRHAIAAHTREVFFGNDEDVTGETRMPDAKAAWANLCYILSHTRHLYSFSGFAVPDVPWLDFIAISATKTLTHLNISIPRNVFSAELIAPVNLLVNLRWLHIENHGNWPRKYIPPVMNPETVPILSLPRLEVLSTCSFHRDAPEGFPAPWYINPKSAFPSLTHLNTQTSLLSCSEEAALVRQFGSRLTHLAVQHISKDLLLSLSTAAPHLQEIDFEDQMIPTEPLVFDHPRLRRLSLSGTTYHSPFLLSLRKELLPMIERITLLCLGWVDLAANIKLDEEEACVLQWIVHFNREGIAILDCHDNEFGGLLRPTIMET